MTKGRKPRRVWKPDHGALQRVMNKLQPFTPEELMNLRLPPRMAFEALRTGKGVDEDFHCLSAAVNATGVLCESVSPVVLAVTKVAQAAMLRTLLRHHTTDRWGFDGPALHEIPPALDLHDQFLELNTPLQMQEALTESLVRLHAGVYYRSPYD